MQLIGWIALVVGIVLLVVSLVWMLRANPGSQVPYLRNPEIVPRGAIGVRSIGAAGIILGMAMLVPVLGSWVVLVAVGAPVIAFVTAIGLHNRRVDASD